MKRHARTTLSTLVGVALAAALPWAIFAQAQEAWAQDPTTGQSPSEEHQSTSKQRQSIDRWNEKRQKTISAREFLGADVRDAPGGLGRPLGRVRDVLLNEDSTAIEYVLYEVPYPYSLYGMENGFVPFDKISVEDSVLGIVVHLTGDPSEQAPEKVRITKKEAEHRLVSRLLGEPVAFSDDKVRAVEDLLIDRATGKITYFVVNENPEAWFNQEPRTVPADQVSIDATGHLLASIPLSRVARL